LTNSISTSNSRSILASTRIGGNERHETQSLTNSDRGQDVAEGASMTGQGRIAKGGAWALAILVLAVIDLAFLPTLLDDRVRAPADVLPHFSPLGTVVEAQPIQNGITGDWIAQFRWWQRAVHDSWQAGRVPLWNERSGCGMPLAANLQSEALSPFLPLLLGTGLQYPDWRQFAQLLLAQILSLWLGRRLGLGPLASMTLGLAYSFGYYLQAWAMHPLAASAAFAPGVMAAFLGMRHKLKGRYIIEAGLLLGASILAGHIETSFKIGLICGAVGLFFWPRESGLKAVLGYFAGIAGTGLVTVGVSAVLLLPFLELLDHSLVAVSRQGHSVVDHDPAHLATLFDEQALGSPVADRDAYRGSLNYNEGTFFLGRIALLMAGLGLVLGWRLRRPLVLALALAATLPMLLIHGPLVFQGWLAHLPPFDTMIMTRLGYCSQLPVAMLAAIGMDELRRASRAEVLRASSLTLGAALVLAILVALTSSMASEIALQGRGLALVGGACLLVALAARRIPTDGGATGLRPWSTALRFGILALLVLEGFWAWSDFVPEVEEALLDPPAPSLVALKEAAGNERVLIPRLLAPAVAETYGIHRVRRYDPAATARLWEYFYRPGFLGSDPENYILQPRTPALDAMAVSWVYTNLPARTCVGAIWRRSLAPGTSLEIPHSDAIELCLRRPGGDVSDGTLRISPLATPAMGCDLLPGTERVPGLDFRRDVPMIVFGDLVFPGERPRFVKSAAANGGLRFELKSTAPSAVEILGLKRDAFGPAGRPRKAQQFHITPRPTALPFAYAAAGVAPASDLAGALALWRRPDFDPRRQTIFECERAPLVGVREAAGLVGHRRSTPERIDIDVGHDRGDLVVVAESWAPGWRARAEDRELEVRPANVATLGVIVPPGVRRFTLEYRPRSFELGALFSGITVLSILLYLLWAYRRRRGLLSSPAPMPAPTSEN
jgi:hypothetical protein